MWGCVDVLANTRWADILLLPLLLAALIFFFEFGCGGNVLPSFTCLPRCECEKTEETTAVDIMTFLLDTCSAEFKVNSRLVGLYLDAYVRFSDPDESIRKAESAEAIEIPSDLVRSLISTLVCVPPDCIPIDWPLHVRPVRLAIRKLSSVIT